MKNKLKSFFKIRNTSQIVVSIILLTLIVLPIVRMLFNINYGALKSVFGSENFYLSLLNSITSTLVATIFSLILAYFLAWAITRTNIKFKYLFTVILTLPMLIPSISHGMGLTILFGNNGIITRLFNSESTIYGFWGVVFGSVLYSFPVAFIMICDILKYEDYSQYEAANVLGIPKFRQFSSITLPYLRKPMISVIFAIFTMIITDYGVTLSVGGKFKTLSVMLYEDAVGQLNYSTGSVIGLILLLPAISAFIFDLFNNDKGSSSYVHKKYKSKSKISSIVGYIIVITNSLLVLTVFFSFIIQAFAKSYPSDLTFTFDHFNNTFSKNGGKYLLNSLLMSFFTALFGVAFATSTAYLSARLKTRYSKILHLFSIVSLAVPGLVLGLAYVIIFKKTFFYGTMVILIMVNIAHFFASPYLMIYNAFGKINENLEDVGHILNIKRSKIFFDVIIPQCKNSLIEMFTYFFANSMMTISAVSFLSTPNNKPISLLINQFETFNMLESAAVVAILILLVNVSIKLIFYIIKKAGNRHDNKKAI